MSKIKKIVVGLSGGVDSSVTAWLLKERGFHIEAVFMKNWEEDDTMDHCSAAKDLQDAQAVCDRLNIRLHTVSFAAEYWDHVFEHFLVEYRAGRTPNPDILCNKEIKFHAFLDFAIQHLQADKIATGHYARIHKKEGMYYLLKGIDANKDQSYFLYALDQTQLSKSLMLIGDFEKTDVRLMAKKAGLPTHDKKDSTGICFIGERRFKDFLKRYLPMQKGAVETIDGDVLGEHDGLMYYTLGQRQGIGIGGKKGYNEKPWYVIGKNLTRNVLIVSQEHDHPHLLSTRVYAQKLSWISGEAPNFPLHCTAKVRYRQKELPCVVTPASDALQIDFETPPWAPTPGQSIVLYQGEECLGGGMITVQKL